MAKKGENEWEANRKVFIGGLKLETTEDELEAAFGCFGEIYDHVVIRESETRRSRGFGFVTFEKPESVQATLDARPIQISGKTVDVKRAVPRSESVSTTPPEIKTQKLFIGGILTSTTDEQLREAFTQYGKINNVDIMKDKDGHSRGFAFVVFEECESVERIVQQRYVTINGKSVECKRAEPFGSLPSSRSRRSQDDMPSYDRPSRGRGGRGRGGRDSHNGRDRFTGAFTRYPTDPYAMGARGFESEGYSYYEGGGYPDSYESRSRGFGASSYPTRGYRESGAGYSGSYSGGSYSGGAYAGSGYSPGRTTAVGGNYGSSSYQDYYSSGYPGRGGGYEGSSTGSQYSFGKYDVEPSSFGPMRGYTGSSGGSGGLLGRPGYQPYSH